MKRKKWVWLVLLLALIAAAFLLTRGGQEEQYAEEAAKTGDLTTYYSFSGHISARSTQTVTAPAAASVRDIYVREYDAVKKDDKLLRLSDGTVLRAQIDGEVSRLRVEEDDEVAAGQTLAELADFSDLEIEIKVDEYDVSAIERGQTVSVTVGALDASFDTTVKSIDRMATRSGDVAYYTVTLAFDAQAGVLPGMQVDGRLIKQQAKNVTLLKVSALSFDDYNQPYVLMRAANGRTVEEVPVTVGISDGAYVEIISGVRSGESVLVRQQSDLEKMNEMMQGGRRSE